MMRRSRLPHFNCSASSISLTKDHSHNISSLNSQTTTSLALSHASWQAVFVCHHSYAHDQAINPLCRVLSKKSSVTWITCVQSLLKCGAYARFILSTHLSRLAQILSPTGSSFLLQFLFTLAPLRKTEGINCRPTEPHLCLNLRMD